MPVHPHGARFTDLPRWSLVDREGRSVETLDQLVATVDDLTVFLTSRQASAMPLRLIADLEAAGHPVPRPAGWMPA